MAKRRTRKQKLKSQTRPKVKVRQQNAPAETQGPDYFRQDLRYSLIVIVAILLLELGIWYLLGS